MSRHDTNPPHHDETPYTETPYTDTPYTDTPYTDTPYTDTPYTDTPPSHGSGSDYQFGATSVPDDSSDLSSQIGESAHDMMDLGRDKATAQLDSQRMRLAEGLDVLAQAIRTTSHELQGEQGTLASYANQGATQVDHLAHYLQDHDVNDLVHDVERYARQSPALFIGGAFALGLLAARFLKSSNR